MKKLYFIILLIFLSVCVFGKDFTLGILDVGQGLCCVVISPDNHCLVYDCGTMNSKDLNKNKDVYKRILAPYLKDYNIKKIDCLVLSHPNLDHYSGFFDLMDNYKIEKYIKNGYKSESKTYNELMKLMAKKNLKTIVAKPNYYFYLGKDVKCTVLSPYSVFKPKDDNDLCVMMRVEYKKTSFLLTGDSSDTCEKYLAKVNKNIKSNVLIVSHHGSKYSSANSFLNSVKPQISIISCGKNNRYGHPHQAVLNRLKKIKSHIYRTDKDGSVICRSDGKKISVYKKNYKSKFLF